MQAVKLFFRYLKYRLQAKHAGGYGVHSPFMFKFITEVMEEPGAWYAQDDIAELYDELCFDKRRIQISDFGAGSRIDKSNQRSISSLARHSAVKKKFGDLLFRIVKYYKPDTILELGSSLGVSSLYMALARPEAKLYSIEACPETAKIAAENFKILQAQNIRLIKGTFEDKLSEILTEINEIDLAFFDGNHRKGPTLNYFNHCLAKASKKSIFIFDDIHWSRGMEEAWSEIKKNQKVRMTADLFFFGIAFLSPDLPEQDFVIKF